MYFATLWRDEDTKLTIEKHIKRRGDGWILIESVGDCDADIKAIVQTINGVELPLNIMVDGITNWCRYCSQTNKEFIAEAERVANNIVKITNAYPEVAWYFLDNVREDFGKVPRLLEMWDIVNMAISTKVNQLNIVSWDNEKNLLLNREETDNS